jgi:hypothetical protein
MLSKKEASGARSQLPKIAKFNSSDGHSGHVPVTFACATEKKCAGKASEALLKKGYSPT